MAERRRAAQAPAVIPYGRQSIDDSDLDAVAEVLRGDWLTQGPAVEAFEEALAAQVGARYAVAFANGTAALHGACSAAELGPGDTVATSTLSFIASANCARYVGSDVTLLDIGPDSLNIDPSAVPKGLDAVIPVHFAGLPIDLSVMRHRPRVVIEDAAHALGAITPDGPVGNCAHSDMCCFSFHPVKAITTAEGGAVTTNDEELAKRLRSFRSHGVQRNPEWPGWYYEVAELGYNYRLSDVHAALGISQLARLEHFIETRNGLAENYRSGLIDLPLALPPEAPRGWRHAYHLFQVRVPRRDHVYQAMRASNIGVQVHYVPIHRHPIYRHVARPADMPEAERAYAELLTLPLHPGLSAADQSVVIKTLETVLCGA